MRTVLAALHSAAFTVSRRDSLAKLNRATRKQSNDQQNSPDQRTARRKCDRECYTYWNIKSHRAVRVQPSISRRPLSIPTRGIHILSRSSRSRRKCLCLSGTGLWMCEVWRSSVQRCEPYPGVMHGTGWHRVRWTTGVSQRQWAMH